MSNESWYLLVGGQPYGPYPLAAMRQFVVEGRVTPQSMVRQGETGAWTAAGQMPDLSPGPAAAAGYPPGGFPPAVPWAMRSGRDPTAACGSWWPSLAVR